MHSLFRYQEGRLSSNDDNAVQRTDWRREQRQNMSSYSSELSRSQEYLSFRSSVPLRKIVVDADGTKVLFCISFPNRSISGYFYFPLFIIDLRQVAKRPLNSDKIEVNKRTVTSWNISTIVLGMEGIRF